MAPVWLRGAEGRVTLSLWVQPGAKKNELLGVHDDCLKIRVRAAAVEGAANKAVIEFIAELLQCKLNQVSLCQGRQQRRKVLAIEGISLAEIRACFERLLSPRCF